MSDSSHTKATRDEYREVLRYRNRCKKRGGVLVGDPNPTIDEATRAFARGEITRSEMMDRISRKEAAPRRTMDA